MMVDSRFQEHHAHHCRVTVIIGISGLHELKRAGIAEGDVAHDIIHEMVQESREVEDASIAILTTDSMFQELVDAALQYRHV